MLFTNAKNKGKGKIPTYLFVHDTPYSSSRLASATNIFVFVVIPGIASLCEDSTSYRLLSFFSTCRFIGAYLFCVRIIDSEVGDGPSGAVPNN